MCGRARVRICMYVCMSHVHTGVLRQQAPSGKLLKAFIYYQEIVTNCPLPIIGMREGSHLTIFEECTWDKCVRNRVREESGGGLGGLS